MAHKKGKGFTGLHHTEAARNEMSKTRKGKHLGKNNPMFGKYHTDAWRKEHSEAMRGKNNPMFGKTNRVFGWHHSGKTRKEISKSHLGKHWSKEQREKMRDVNRGEKCYAWKGGISFEPYCYMFNRPFKNRVRARYDYTCVECEKTQEENGRLLDVHHVNYDKMVCCNDVKPLFVALCHSCNSKANGNREFWEDWFTEIINEFYDGQCYLPKV
jgi:hypothetical protein